MIAVPILAILTYINGLKNTEKSIKLPPVLLECNMELGSNYSKPKNIQYSKQCRLLF